MANTSFKTLYSDVMFRLNLGEDGRALYAAKKAVNDAHKYIARVKDFDELMVNDTSNAVTVASTKTYHIVDDWGLTRPKDLFSLRYMNEGSSRKLMYLTPKELDEKLPYVEGVGETNPMWYTVRGSNVELIPIPNAAKSVYIYYSQWPLTLTDDTDLTSYEQIDDVIVALASDIALDILRSEKKGYGEKVIGDWPQKAKEYLGLAVREKSYRPDRKLVAQPFGSTPNGFFGEPWKDPFIKEYS